MAFLDHISTHSPARGLTTWLLNVSFVSLFQLTAPQGDWQAGRQIRRILWYFNSQPRKGTDKKGKHGVLYDCISTHSPARGLTVDMLSFYWQPGIFQLTAPQGDWRWMRWSYGSYRRFQLTAPQGDWLQSGSPRLATLRFQLTAPQGDWQQFEPKILPGQTCFLYLFHIFLLISPRTFRISMAFRLRFPCFFGANVPRFFCIHTSRTIIAAFP